MPVYLDCAVCGKEFAVPPSRAKTAKACSHECARSVRGESRRRSETIVCKNCGRTFTAPRSHVDRRVYCSRECQATCPDLRQARSARMEKSGNPQWVGGSVGRLDGYRYRHVGTGHPFSTAAGYILEHRAVMEKHLVENDPDSPFLVKLGARRYLSPDFHVHHVDEDKANNAIGNLMCVTPTEHRALHKR